MTTLYLHIGMPKCGTTSLQMALARNADKLARQGVYYPRLRDKPFHHDIFYAIRDQRMSSLDEQFAEIADKARSLPKTIISTENFCWDHRPEIVDATKSFFSNFDTVKIIIFLRNIFDFHNSWYCEHIQGFENQGTEDVADFFTEDRLEKLNFVKILANWRDTHGKDNVSIAFVDKIGNDGDSLIEAFLRLVGSEIPEGFATPKRKFNISLNAPQIIAKRQINAIKTATTRREHTQILDFVREISESRNLPGAGKSLLGARHVERIDRFYRQHKEAMHSMLSPTDVELLTQCPNPTDLLDDTEKQRLEKAAREIARSDIPLSGPVETKTTLT